MVFAILAFGILGTVTELLLLGHTESWQQWIPVVALLAGGAVLVPVGRRPRPGVLRLMRRLMMAWIAIGALGVFYHVRGNLEFELERERPLSRLQIAWNTMTGATPILGPGAMVLLGLLGLTYLHEHPTSTILSEDRNA